MGTIFKYNDQLIQCKNLQKKLKKMRIPQDSIEIIKDGIPDDSLEKEFVNLTKVKKEEVKNNKTITLYTYSNGSSKIVSIYNTCPEGHTFVGSKIYEI